MKMSACMMTALKSTPEFFATSRSPQNKSATGRLTVDDNKFRTTPNDQVSIKLTGGNRHYSSQCTPAGRYMYFLRVDGPLYSFGNDFLTFTESDNAAAHLVTARRVQSKANSRAAVPQCQEWFEECVSHKPCWKPATRLPPRVVEVTSTNGSLKAKVRENRGEGASYIALSYCWGKQQSGVLTTDNLKLCLATLRTWRDYGNTVSSPHVSFRCLLSPPYIISDPSMFFPLTDR